MPPLPPPLENPIHCLLYLEMVMLSALKKNLLSHNKVVGTVFYSQFIRIWTVHKTLLSVIITMAYFMV